MIQFCNTAELTREDIRLLSESAYAIEIREGSFVRISNAVIDSHVGRMDFGARRAWRVRDPYGRFVAILTMNMRPDGWLTISWDEEPELPYAFNSSTPVLSLLVQREQELLTELQVALVRWGTDPTVWTEQGMTPLIPGWATCYEINRRTRCEEIARLATLWATDTTS